LQEKIVLPSFDDVVKSPPLRRSRAGGNPERIEMTGFPPARE